MHSLSIPYPDDLLITSGKSPQALEAELAFLLAVKLFELHRLSLGKAATFCGMDKLRFMYELGRLQIPVINLDDDQIADELRDDACIEDLLFYQDCKAAKEEGFLSDQEAQEFVANLPPVQTLQG